MAAAREQPDRQAFVAVVTGRVQGVGFRWATRRVAEPLGITGWVRNRPGGAVEVFAQGSAAALARLSAFLADGPQGAVVTSVQETETDPGVAMSAFEIRL